MNEKKPPPTPETSLNYIAWSLKDVVKQITEVNKTLLDIKKIFEEKLLM